MWKEPEPKAGAHFTDAQVASMVRMLMRDQLDHEAVCIVARDRIVSLTTERDQLRAEVERLRTALEASQYNLTNLLATIHRDGGHYLAEHGEAKAFCDALGITVNTTARAEAAEAREAGELTAAEVIEAAEEAIKDERSPLRLCEPSCQKDAVSRCMCRYCTSDRTTDAIALIARYKEAHHAK